MEEMKMEMECTDQTTRADENPEAESENIGLAGLEKQGDQEERNEQAEQDGNLNELPEMLYAEDKRPGKNAIRAIGNGEMISGNENTALSLTDRDKMTLGKIRDLAADHAG